jgi:hypothetical protein
MGKCATLAAPVFCCSSMMCTGSAICEFANGTVSQCDQLDAGPITPVIDGGISAGQCEMVSCTKGAGGDELCHLACGGSATCVDTGGKQHCMP